MTAIDRGKITWYMNKLYRDITFAKTNVYKIKECYIDKDDDREYLVEVFKDCTEDNIKQLIKILNKFY